MKKYYTIYLGKNIWENVIDDMKKIILDLCGGTGAWSKPYQEDPDYEVYVLTLPDHDILNFKTIPSEVCYAMQENNVYGILAAPPCTQFSIARNDKTANEPRDLIKGMKTVKQCLRYIEWCQDKKFRRGEGLKFWALENPASGYLDRFLGKPAMIFEPYEFGDPYTKKTALWGMFNEPIKTPVKPERGTMVKYASQFDDLKPVDEEYRKKLGVDSRTIRRSITPDGFAQAFYEANK